jgi:hypothetical protein
LQLVYVIFPGAEQFQVEAVLPLIHNQPHNILFHAQFDQSLVVVTMAAFLVAFHIKVVVIYRDGLIFRVLILWGQQPYNHVSNGFRACLAAITYTDYRVFMAV